MELGVKYTRNRKRSKDEIYIPSESKKISYNAYKSILETNPDIRIINGENYYFAKVGSNYFYLPQIVKAGQHVLIFKTETVKTLVISKYQKKDITTFRAVMEMNGKIFYSQWIDIPIHVTNRIFYLNHFITKMKIENLQLFAL